MSLYLTIGIIIGAVLMLGGITFGRKLLESFSSKAKLIQSYWIFVTLFLICSILAYLVIFSQSNGHMQDVLLSIINQWVGIVFAIFVGYFAFAQLMESRLDKLTEKGMEYLEAGDYDSSIKYYEQAHRSSPKDYRALADLSEVYLMVENYDALSRNLALLEKITSKSTKITYYFLCAGSEIMQGHINEATQAIKRTIDYIETNPAFLDMHVWSYVPLQSSTAYRQLNGDKKKMFDNLVSYLSKTMTPEIRAKFVSGDYLQ